MVCSNSVSVSPLYRYASDHRTPILALQIVELQPEHARASSLDRRRFGEWIARNGVRDDERIIDHACTYRMETHVDYKIIGLSPDPFLSLYGLSDAALADSNAKRYRADKRPGFPDRIEIRDAEPGESVLLVNYAHQPASTPYRASHAVFVREGAVRAATFVNEVPESLQVRPLSVRAFDAGHWMVDAELCDGRDLDRVLRRFLGDGRVDYLQVHFATRGCYAARVEKIGEV
jgi:hypothetical protein